jgi:hypothetical protein
MMTAQIHPIPASLLAQSLFFWLYEYYLLLRGPHQFELHLVDRRGNKHINMCLGIKVVLFRNR